MNVLWVEARPITPHMDGGSLRSYEIIRFLLKEGASVKLGSLFPESFSPFDKTLPTDREILENVGISLLANVEHYLERQGLGLDAIVFVGHTVACKFLELARKFAPQAKIIFDTVDMGHLRLFREAKLFKNSPQLARALAIKERERQLSQATDEVWVVSEEEHAIVRSWIDSDRIQIVPHMYVIKEQGASFNQRSDISFLGSFQHAPNEDAVLHFAEDIFPRVLNKLSSVRFKIVGSHPTERVHSLQSDRIDVLGFVEDLDAFFDGIRINVAPLRYGAGIKLKIVLAMGHGVPTVTTPCGAEGFSSTHRKNLLIADNAEEFAAYICELYQNETFWNQISKNSKQLIQTQFSYESVEVTLRKSFRMCYSKFYKFRASDLSDH